MRMRDLKGLRYLARLLADPGREFHVLDLVTVERGWSGDGVRGTEPGLAFSSGLDAGVVLDAQAKQAYRRRLAEIDEDIDEAGMLGDAERAAQAEAERDFLIRELARAVGLGGRDRRVGSASERARASVTRAVRKAMARIGEYDPALGEHLDRAIRTGTWCAYLPDPRAPVSWTAVTRVPTRHLSSPIVAAHPIIPRRLRDGLCDAGSPAAAVWASRSACVPNRKRFFAPLLRSAQQGRSRPIAWFGVGTLTAVALARHLNEIRADDWPQPSPGRRS